jgi:hypothetical protein
MRRQTAVTVIEVLATVTGATDGGTMEQQEYEARCALDVARLQARAKGLKVRVQLVRTRHPGGAIVK